MKASIWLLVLTLLSALAFAGCPRDKTDDDGGTNISVVTDTDTSDESATEGASSETMTSEGDETVEGASAEGDAAADQAGDTATDETATDGTTTEGDAAVSTETVEVVLETTKGNVVFTVHKDWAPIGAERFIALVKEGFYDGAPWFRVVQGFVAQAGIAADPAVDQKWRNSNINDDPVVKGNTRGLVSFAMAGPSTRSTQFFVNLSDNSAGLDRQGFAAFAEVTEGLDVVDSFYVTGDGTVNQGLLMQRGIDYFRSVAPNGDTIIKAYVRE